MGFFLRKKRLCPVCGHEKDKADIRECGSCRREGCGDCVSWRDFYVVEKAMEQKYVSIQVFCSYGCERRWVDESIKEFAKETRARETVLSEDELRRFKEWLACRLGHSGCEVYCSYLEILSKEVQRRTVYDCILDHGRFACINLSPQKVIVYDEELTEDPKEQLCSCGNNMATRSAAVWNGEPWAVCQDCYIIGLFRKLSAKGFLEKGLVERGISLILLGVNRERLFEELHTSLEVAKHTERLVRGLYGNLTHVRSIDLFGAIEDYRSEKNTPRIEMEDLITDKGKRTAKLFYDLCDAVSLIYRKAGSRAYAVGQIFDPRAYTPMDVVAVGCMLKAIQYKLPYKYIKEPKLQFEKGQMSDLPEMVEIPRPVKIYETLNEEPSFDIENMTPGSLYCGVDDVSISSNVARLYNDLFSLIECYLTLGKSLLHMAGGSGVGRQLFWGDSQQDVQRWAVFSSKILRYAFPLAIEAFNLTRACIEMLPLAKRKPDFAEGYGATFFDEGLCYHQQNKFDNAKECFARALHIYEGEEKWPAPKNAELGIADCHLYIGMCLEAQGDRKEAREHIEESLRISTILEVRDNIQRANGLLKKMESQSQRR